MVSFRPDSATYILITQRHLLVPSLIPYEYQLIYSQEKQKEYTQRAQPRKPVELGIWQQQIFIITETVPVGHMVTWSSRTHSPRLFLSSFAEICKVGRSIQIINWASCWCPEKYVYLGKITGNNLLREDTRRTKSSWSWQKKLPKYS